MSKIAIVTGFLLVIVGLAGYLLPSTVVTDGPDGETIETITSWTALIPAFIGLPILLCGFWSFVAPASTKTALHLSATIALLGGLAAAGRGIVSLLKFINADGEFNQRTFMFLVLMGVLCWMYVIACVLSFIKVRKARERAEATE